MVVSRHLHEGPMSIETLRQQFEPLRLSPGGFHWNDTRPDAWYSLATLERNWQERIENLEAEIVLAEEWLRRVKRTKAVYKGATSYGLKHEVENWHRHVRCFPPGRGGYYLPNGAFIMAAYRLGFTVQPIASNPNAYINVSRASVQGWWPVTGKLRVLP